MDAKVAARHSPPFRVRSALASVRSPRRVRSWGSLSRGSSFLPQGSSAYSVILEEPSVILEEPSGRRRALYFLNTLGVPGLADVGPNCDSASLSMGVHPSKCGRNRQVLDG